MAYNTPARFYGPNTPATSNTVLYTSTAGAIIKEIIFSNGTTNTPTISIGINGVASSNLICSTMLMASATGNNIVIFPLATVLATSDTLNAWQSAASAIVVTVSGVRA